MKREELAIDDGIICLSVNGKHEIVFNPTDLAFVEKVVRVFEQLTEKQEETETSFGGSKARDIFGIAREKDAEMRVLVDSALGDGACAALFGDMNVYACADGIPVWSNLLLAILDRCEGEFVEQQKLQSPRLQKYISKYKR